MAPVAIADVDAGTVANRDDATKSPAQTSAERTIAFIPVPIDERDLTSGDQPAASAVDDKAAALGFPRCAEHCSGGG